MADEYMDAPDVSMMNEAASRVSDGENISDGPKDFGDISGYDENYEDDDGGNNFRNGRGRGNFRGRGRGPPPGWMNGPPMRFRGRGYGPGGPPMRGRGFFRGRGGPRGFGPNNGPNFDNNWGPMGPPPPGMMGGPPPFGPPPGMMPPGGPMGPPPNMMGQPPPFGGPPGMPPPNMPAPELWVETKSEEGKSYYYHARTRETTWTRPQDTPTCKVITQSEMEAMAASGQMPNMGGPQSMPMGGPPMGGPPMGGPPMGMMPNGMMGGMMPPGVAPQTSVPSFMSQPPPWVKDGEDFYKGAKDKNMDEDSPNDNDDMPPGESAPVTSSNGNMNFSNAPPTNFPPGGFPGGPGGPGPGGPGGPGGFPGGWGGWGSWPPPMGPPSMATAAVPEVGAAGQMPQLGGAAPASLPPVSETLIIDSPTHTPVKKDETVIPASVATLAAAWSTHVAPDGRPYYYHAANQESVWEKPKPIRDLEELQAKIAAEKGEKVEKKIDKIEIDDSKIEVIDVEAHAEAAAALEAERAAAAERDRDRDRDRARAAERDRLERERDRERQDQERLDKEKADKEKAKQDRSRPISSTPISGTPWCVVWTGDGRVFFYNPTAHSSVWERPPQLAARADVDKAVTNPPAQLQDLQRKESTTAAATPAAVAASSRANGDLKRVADSDSDDSDSDPPKKVKPDDTKKATTTSTGAGNIDLGKEAAIEAEVRAARERAVVPHEQRVRSFTTMLRDKDVSAFSTWEKELQKIVFDPRYLMLDSKERRQVFDQYVRERAEEERKEKKNRLQQKKVAFRALMEEAKLHAKSSYTEFSSKHGRDERFKAIEKPRDRETYFNEFIAEVRKREKEDKEKKREQVKGEFIAMLKEKAVDRRARWAEAKKKVDSEPRYKAVESSTLRDDYFREYCKMVKEERKKEKDVKEKEKERDRSSSKKEKKDKDRDKDKEKEKDKDKDKERDKESKKDKKKEKGGEKTEPAEGERKQPTPPPDQWAEILGIPGEDDSRSKSSKSSKKNPDTSSERSEKSKSESPEPEIRSPKQLRSSKKVASPEKKTLIKTPPKKRKDFKSPEPEKKVVKKKVEKVEKTEKRKRKKSEKE